MAATGNEVPLLSQLKALKDWVVNQGYLKSVPVASPTVVGGIKSLTPEPMMDNYAEYGVIVGPGKETASVKVTYATSSTAGLMSAADKVKLDALPESFTAPAVDIVKTTAHSTSYTRDTLEIVCDSTGKVTAMYFVSA